VETLSRSRGLTRRKRSMAASFVSNHRVLFRQSGASGAFHSSALYRLEMFQTVPRRFLSRSFVLVGTNPGDRFLISLAPPSGLNGCLLSWRPFLPRMFVAPGSVVSDVFPFTGLYFFRAIPFGERRFQRLPGRR